MNTEVPIKHNYVQNKKNDLDFCECGVAKHLHEEFYTPEEKNKKENRSKIGQVSSELDLFFEEKEERNQIYSILDKMYANRDYIDVAYEDIRHLLKTTAQKARRERDEEYKPIIKWLLGEEGDFPNLAEKPHYRFRTELRQRLQKLNPDTGV